MGLINLISKSIFGLKGKTPQTLSESLPNSTLHNTYSINGNPARRNSPMPSRLDLNGLKPKAYLDNLPK